MTDRHADLIRRLPGAREEDFGLDQATEERAAEEDRRWFEEHPGRSHQLRERLAGEMGTVPKENNHVVVRQVEPGQHIRLPITFGDTPPPDNDAALAKLMDILSTGGAAYWIGDRVFALDEVPVKTPEQ